MHAGKLIVIDGTDGSGKATQTELLVKRLRQEGHQVETIAFPRHGLPSVAGVDAYLRGVFGPAQEVDPRFTSMLYAWDRFVAAPQIREWLKDGKIVIADRYTSANQGHQAGKISDHGERDEFLGWLDELEYGFFKIPKPDLTVLLYVPPEVSQQLAVQRGAVTGQGTDIHEADADHLQKASEAFRYVAEKYRWPIVECAPHGQLLTINQVHQLLWDQVKMFF